MRIDWRELKETMNMYFVNIPIFVFLAAMSDHDSLLRYGSITEVIIYVCFYIFVRVKATKQTVYNSDGKRL